jgi:predicted  nucleic acid-binding Zn-ribbon protein
MKEKEEIKELKREIKALKQRINGLEKDLDYQIEHSSGIGNLKMCIRELQEEVAKIKNEPVGMLFTWLK